MGKVGSKAKVGRPKGIGGKGRAFKFLVSFRVTLCGSGKVTETSFSYHDFRTATKSYKTMLLSLYRKKEC